MTAPALGVTMTAEGHALEVTIQHGPSSTPLLTVPPRDNGGTGESFSPTDLLGAALASCALLTMSLAASREGLAFGDTQAKVEKRMTPPPRRVGELLVSITMPAGFPKDLRSRYEEIARSCPVARSLHPEVRAPMEFVYRD